MSVKKIIAHVDDLQDGQMKEIDINGRSILLAKVNGQYHAIGAHCTHYGAPLAKGMLHGYHVVCPWHHTYFNILTGDMEEPPGLDGLPHFDLKIVGKDVIITLTDDIHDHRTMSMVQHDSKADARTFVIIGAGAAGSAAAEALRQDGFQGRIVMISHEKNIPYDRPHLSKGYLREKGQASGPPTLRSFDFYHDHGIELMMDRKVERVDIAERRIDFKDQSTLKYDSLLVASGGHPRYPNVPGIQLRNVFLLRTFNDAHAIATAAEKAPKVIILGAGFIGMEVASGLAERGLSVTVVAQEPTPFSRTFGPEIGEMLKKVHEKDGINFEMQTEVERFEGKEKVQAAILKNGKRIETDMVIIGMGVKPATDFLQDIEKNPDGSVTVDEYMKLTDNVYAAGDIAEFPDWRTGQPIRIEHWRVAQQQGRCAAHNMAGHQSELRSVPFFWTTQLKISIRYVGHITDWDEIIYHGKPEDMNFIAFYVKDNRVLGVAGCGHDVKMAAANELMRENRMPTPQELRQGKEDMINQLNPSLAAQL